MSDSEDFSSSLSSDSISETVVLIKSGEEGEIRSQIDFFIEELKPIMKQINAFNKEGVPFDKDYIYIVNTFDYFAHRLRDLDNRLQTYEYVFKKENLKEEVKNDFENKRDLIHKSLSISNVNNNKEVTHNQENEKDPMDVISNLLHRLEKVERASKKNIRLRYKIRVLRNKIDEKEYELKRLKVNIWQFCSSDKRENYLDIALAILYEDTKLREMKSELERLNNLNWESDF